jgi:malate synthase
VLIETLPAAFEMHEILYELRDHSAGLNCGRWDYIFSFIKTVHTDPHAILPERSELTMDGGFLRPYSRLLIETCHRRGVHAMGGMAAQIPRKDDPEQNKRALDRVRADKLREVTDGHDGTWVAHPGLVELARDIFDANMKGKNQIDRKLGDARVTRNDLLSIPQGARTEAGLRHDIRVGLQYLESWLRGIGCVPIYYLMEDAATAEISRSQIWQWIRSPKGKLHDGRKITKEMVSSLVPEELIKVRAYLGEAGWNAGKYEQAAKMFEELSLADEFVERLSHELGKDVSEISASGLKSADGL